MRLAGFVESTPSAIKKDAQAAKRGSQSYPFLVQIGNQ